MLSEFGWIKVWFLVLLLLFYVLICFKTKEVLEASAENEEDFPLPTDSNLYMSSGRQHVLKKIFFLFMEK